VRFRYHSGSLLRTVLCALRYLLGSDAPDVLSERLAVVAPLLVLPYDVAHESYGVVASDALDNPV